MPSLDSFFRSRGFQQFVELPRSGTLPHTAVGPCQRKPSHSRAGGLSGRPAGWERPSLGLSEAWPSAEAPPRLLTGLCCPTLTSKSCQHLCPQSLNYANGTKLYVNWLADHFMPFFFLSFFLSFVISRAAPAAYGGSQAPGLIGTVAAGLRHSHSNAGSEPCLRPTPQPTATPDL